MPLLKSKSDYEAVMGVCLAGGVGLNYRLTPVAETEMARAADPFRFDGLIPDNWWTRGEPREADGRAMLRLLDHASKSLYGRDRKRARGRDDVEAEQPAGHVASDADEFAEYLPKDNERLSDWLPELAKNVDTTGVSKVLFDSLRAFCERFAGKKFNDLDEGARGAISAFVRLLSMKEAA